MPETPDSKRQDSSPRRSKRGGFTSQMKQIVGAVAMTIGVGGAGYAALTEIPRTTVTRPYDLTRRVHGGPDIWHVTSGTRYLFGDLKDGEFRSWDGSFTEGHFKPKKDTWSISELDGPGKRYDPRGESYANQQQIFHDAKALREEGEFKDNKLHGHGKRERMDGAIIEGEFAYGLPNGHAIVTFKDGSKVVGEFQNIKPTSDRNPLLDGVAIEAKPGDTISFSFSSSPLQGMIRGTYTDAKGEVIFDGEVDENRNVINGTQKLDMKHIGTYSGEIKNKEAHGKGILKLQDGRIFEGVFNQGSLVGQNIFFNLSEQSLYEGEMKDGVPHGEGVRISWNHANAQGTFTNGRLSHGKEIDDRGTTNEGDFDKEGRLITGHRTYHPDALPPYDHNRFLIETDIKFGFADGPAKMKAGYEIIEGWFVNGKFLKHKPGEGGVPQPAEYHATPNGQKIFRITNETRAAFYPSHSGECFWVPKDTLPDNAVKIDSSKLPEAMQEDPDCWKSIPHPNLFDD